MGHVSVIQFLHVFDGEVHMMQFYRPAPSCCISSHMGVPGTCIQGCSMSILAAPIEMLLQLLGKRRVSRVKRATCTPTTSS